MLWFVNTLFSLDSKKVYKCNCKSAIFAVVKNENWGLVIKRLREEHHITQGELAKSAGVSRSTISLIEIGKRKSPREEQIEYLAKGLFIKTGELRRILYPDTDFPEHNKLPHPDQIPIYTEFPFHAGSVKRPVEYAYRTWPGGKAPKNIEGYIVHGECLEPTIQDGDTIIVDREGVIEIGDIIACSIEGELHLGRLRKIADELWLENGHGRLKFQECQVAAPVIEINRRIKYK